MNDFTTYLAEREKTKRCGTQATWYAPQFTTYVIPPRDPVDMELVRSLWPELEAVK